MGALLVIAVSILFFITNHREAHAFKLPDMGKSIEKSVQDVGKSIERFGKDIDRDAHDIGKSIEKKSLETEHSPSDPCSNNSKLPQCDLDKVAR